MGQSWHNTSKVTAKKYDIRLIRNPERASVKKLARQAENILELLSVWLLCGEGPHRCIFCNELLGASPLHWHVVAHDRREVLGETARMEVVFRTSGPSFTSPDDTRPCPNTRFVAHDRIRSKEADSLPGMEPLLIGIVSILGRKSREGSTIEMSPQFRNPSQVSLNLPQNSYP